MAALVQDPELDRTAPRAPTEEEWERMAPAERRRAVDALPAHMTEAELAPPEGDPHLGAKVEALETLRTFFERTRRNVYVGCELTVYYPGKRRFAPDLLAVCDVDPHPRMKWVVSDEGKGLDWVMEVHVAGDMRKDLEDNVKFYGALGIPEYFIYDRGRQRLTGFRLAEPRARSYQPIIPQAGRYDSAALGLDLVIEEGRLRFYSGSAELLSPRDLAQRLERMVEEVQTKAEERVREEQARVREEQARVREEQERVREAERRIAELQAEIERLRSGR